MIRSAEIEIDTEKISYRDQLRNEGNYRAEVVAAHFLKSGNLGECQSTAAPHSIPSQIEDFDQLSNSLEIRCADLKKSCAARLPPSQLWASTKLYGVWVALPLLLYAAMAQSSARDSHTRMRSGRSGAFAWLFAWSGSKIEERKWKVLLPLTGYLAAAVLLGRAWSLGLSH
jgi:hypothetical protein